MEDGKANDENSIEEIPTLNKILESLVSDASELIRDLNWSVKTYLIFGLMSTLFGIEVLAQNMESLAERFYIPLFVSGALIFCGVAQIITFYRLRKKYSRLFKVQTELKS